MKNNTMERCIAALKAGKVQDALDIATAGVANAVRDHGKDSPEEARALFDQANVFAIIGNGEGALANVNRACEIPVKDDDSRKMNLEYLKAKGELLQKMGRFDEAKAAYEKSNEGRAEVYGKDSAGLCHGLLPLADLYLHTNKLEEAEKLIEGVAGCFWHEKDPMLVPALSLRGFIIAARHGDDKPMFEQFDMLSDQQQHQLVGVAIQMAQAVPAEAAFLGLQELRERLEEFQSPDLRQDAMPFAQELGAVVELQHAIARRQNKLDRIEETLSWLGHHYESQHNIPQHLTVQMRQAHLLRAQNHKDEALAAFKAVAKRLDDLSDKSLEIAMPLRCELGALFDAAKENELAEEMFRKAVAQAEISKDPRHVASTCSALGYFLQHHDRPGDAFEWLEKAHAIIKDDGFAALELRIHMNAIINGTKCGCSEKADALTLEIDRRVRAQLPEGLLDGVRISPAKGIEMVMKRKPTQEEQETLKKAIPAALEQIKSLNITKPQA